MPIRRTASLQTITQPEQSRSLGDKRQVVSVDRVKWAAIVEVGTRVGSARDDRKKRGLGSFRADIACELIKAHHLSTSCCMARVTRSHQNPKNWRERHEVPAA